MGRASKSLAVDSFFPLSLSFRAALHSSISFQGRQRHKNRGNRGFMFFKGSQSARDGREPSVWAVSCFADSPVTSHSLFLHRKSIFFPSPGLHLSWSDARWDKVKVKGVQTSKGSLCTGHELTYTSCERRTFRTLCVWERVRAVCSLHLESGCWKLLLLGGFSKVLMSRYFAEAKHFSRVYILGEL